MSKVYRYDGKKVIEMEDDKEITTYKSLKDFIDEEMIDTLYMELSHGHNFPIHVNENSIKGIIQKNLLEELTEKFEKNSEISDRDMSRFITNLERKFKTFGKKLNIDIEGFIYKVIPTYINNENNVKIGGDMFKTIKEARSFTAHLDSLASEIEQIEGIAPEMKQHLAYRIDRLSDLIEVSALKEEKTAAIEKEAMGIGSGSWAYDEDEARYMSSFGGTGALKRDPDEPYMDKFTADQDGGDHKEVITRHEPTEIRQDGQKVPQPSDNYNEAEVAQNLRNTIKSMVAAKLKK